MLFLYDIINIGHCDLKPANILKIDEDYNLMITDFGIAKKLRQNSIKFGYTKNISGTLIYTSPEAFNKMISNND